MIDDDKGVETTIPSTPDTMIIINCISASEPIASILPIIIASGLTDVSRSSITFDVFSCAIDCATI